MKDCKVNFPLYLRLWDKDLWEVNVKCHAFVTSALGGGEYSVLHSSFFTWGVGGRSSVGNRTNWTRLRGEQSSLLLFVVNNKYLFTTNNEIHEHNTRKNNNLHRVLSNLTKFNKGPGISGIKAFNQLPHHLKALDLNSSYFRTSLKRFLHHHSFYTIN